MPTFISFLLACVFCLQQQASAEDSKIYIDVGRAEIKKSLLAFPPLLYFSSQPNNKEHIEIGEQLFQTITNNLTVSAFFTFIRQDAFLEDPTKVGLKPAPAEVNGFNFNKWQPIGAEFLIRGGYRIATGKITLEIYAYHVPQAKLVLGKTYEGTMNSARRMAHIFSNDLIRALTGKPGAFLTRVVASRMDTGSPYKDIVVMDWDGQNVQKITNHKSTAISPAWSIDGQKVAYSAFAYHPNAKTRNIDLFIYDLKEEKRWLVSHRTGINSGAAFLMDGVHMLLTISQNGSPDIYKMTLDGKTLTRITNGPNRSMNVEPAVSPDGKKIAFSSDRHGQPHIYIMDIDGSNVKRITFAGTYNSSPTWSPNGKQLAFASLSKGNFDIFTINVDGTDIKRLTSARKPNGTLANNEEPTFSPDGRLIMFNSDRTGSKQLYVISPDGTNERRITLDKHNYEKPKWGP